MSNPDPNPHRPPANSITRFLLDNTFWTMLWRLFTLGLILIALVLVGLVFLGGAPKVLTDGDFMRGLITILLLVTSLVLIVVLILTSLFGDGDDSTSKRVNQGRDVLTPLLGILGTVVGFYFASETSEHAAERATSNDNSGIVSGATGTTQPTAEPGESGESPEPGAES